MNNSIRILKVKNDRFYYTENDFIDILNTNIPIDSLLFKINVDIYWKVELSNYDNRFNSIRVKVIDYYPIDISNFVNQKQNRPLKFIYFESLKKSIVENQTFYIDSSKLSDPIFDDSSNELNILNENASFDEDSRFENFLGKKIGKTRNGNEMNDERTKNSIQINEIFSYSYKNAEFKNGFVRVKFKNISLSKKVEIDISNNYIKSEFNSIKHYFPKHFNKGKQFSVQIIGEIQLGRVIKYNAKSEEIQSINEDVISKIKDLVTIDLFGQIPEETSNKGVHSIEEIIEKSKLGKKIKDIIPREPKKLLGSCLKMLKVKNKKQLEYLSGYKQMGDFQIKFTIKPFFGFLFYIDSTKNNNFCWELLNSHATYVWSFNNQLDSNDKLNQIDNIINYIIKNGREKYKKLLKTNPHPYITFNLVSHKNKKNQNGDNFVEWKNKFEKVINKKN